MQISIKLENDISQKPIIATPIRYDTSNGRMTISGYLPKNRLSKNQL